MEKKGEKRMERKKEKCPELQVTSDIFKRTLYKFSSPCPRTLVTGQISTLS